MLSESHPLIRRVIRFAALPYCYIKLVNWKECTSSKFQVVKDFLYIFFRLKYFPDNYSCCRFWEKDRKEWHYYYGSIYDPYQRQHFRRHLHPKELIVLFANKWFCHQFCQKFHLPVPELAMFAANWQQVQIMVKQQLSENPSTKLIIKDNLGGGGHGIVIAYYENYEKYGRIIVKDANVEKQLDSCYFEGAFILEKYIDQHPLLTNVSSSTNTCRIVTLYTQDGEVILLGGYMRFGLEGEYRDNLCTGGVGANIDLVNGCLSGDAADLQGRLYDKHPNSGVVFDGFEIPYWNEVIDLVEKIQVDFSMVGLLGHDIGISPSGPVIIEINAEPDIVALEMLSGPILLNKRVLQEFANNELLINKYQRDLVNND